MNVNKNSNTLSADKLAETTVVLLAAGHGKRMMPLTAETPKPLLRVGDKSLIAHHLHRLRDCGFKHIVINVAYLADQIKSNLGDGSEFGLTIEYSDESDTGALETAGGIHKALALIKSSAFVVINADIWTDYPFTQIAQPLVNQNSMGKLVLINNPSHNLNGDFGIDDCKTPALISRTATKTLTFSGIAQYKKDFFNELESGRQALAPLLYKAADAKLLEAEHFEGTWTDIGTPERLLEVNQSLAR